MKNMLITKSQLESMSTRDLVALADEYSIDFPESLNRRFIISELLEIAEDLQKPLEDDLQDDVAAFTFYEDLPKNFNETYIGAIMRNPLWCFVYWDIRSLEYKDMEQNPNFLGTTLTFMFYTNDGSVSKESIEIDVNIEKKEQFVLLNAEHAAFRVHLKTLFSNAEPKIIASTEKISIPHIISQKDNTSLDKKISPIVALSGMNEIIREHYNNHRQTFI